MKTILTLSKLGIIAKTQFCSRKLNTLDFNSIKMFFMKLKWGQWESICVDISKVLDPVLINIERGRQRGKETDVQRG